MKRLGMIVNPIAGMGGTVGFKGTDGEEILKKVEELGVAPVSPKRATTFLKTIKSLDEGVQLITYPREMGEVEAREANFTPTVIGKISGKTTALDTKRAVTDMCNLGVSLLVFCGGDGTAKDVLDSIKPGIPVLGVPAGVKMYSAVFARTPEVAGEVVAHYLNEGLPLRESEVMDINEEALRRGSLSAKLYGYMLTPYEPNLVQSSKMTISARDDVDNKRAIARHVVERMEPETVYILGPGTTVKAISEYIGIEKSPLGVDIVCNKSIVAKDVNEEQILGLIRGKKSKIVLSPLGRLGSLIGRGNQEISKKVIRAVGVENIIVVATKLKLASLPLRCLWVDTGDAKLNKELRGYMRVIVDYREEELIKVR